MHHGRRDRTKPRPPSRRRARCAHRVLRRVFEDGAYAEKALQAEAEGLDARDRALAMRLAYGAIQRAGDRRPPDRAARRAAERAHRRAAARLAAARPLRAALPRRLARLRRRRRRRRARQGAGRARPRPRQRRAAARRPRRRAARCSARLSDEDPRHAAVAALASRVDRAAVVGGARAPRQARALMARDNEPARARAAREHARLRRRRARRRGCGVRHPPRPAHPRGARARGALRRPRLAAVAGRRVHRAVARGDARRARRSTRSRASDVLDLCAAPGGKSTHLAALMGDRGSVVAVEAQPAAGRARSS